MHCFWYQYLEIDRCNIRVWHWFWQYKHLYFYWYSFLWDCFVEKFKHYCFRFFFILSWQKDQRGSWKENNCRHWKEKTVCSYNQQNVKVCHFFNLCKHLNLSVKLFWFLINKVKVKNWLGIVMENHFYFIMRFTLVTYCSQSNGESD